MADQTNELSRSKIQEMVVAYAAEKPENREALLADRKRVLSELLNQPIPEYLNVRVAEETADTIFLIAPYLADQLSDNQLEDVAGGGLTTDRHGAHRIGAVLMDPEHLMASSKH